MKGDHRLIALHSAAAGFALVAALAWPRAGQAAMLVPMGTSDLNTVLRWADREDASLLQIDTGKGRVVARVSSDASLLSAIGAGILPIAARKPSCQPRQGEPT